MTTLVMSSRHTADDQALWRAAVRRGWSIQRVRGITVPEIAEDEIVIYVEALLAPTIAERLGRELLDPPENWLAQLPDVLRRRRVELTTLGAARALTGSMFVKPPNDKSFAARVFEDGRALPKEYDDTMAVLVADPVRWSSEYRCFCLDGAVVATSPYLLDGEHAGHGDYVAPPQQLSDACAFANDALRRTTAITPRAIVIDVGIIEDRGWAVVEANGAWGAGIYGCDPNGVLDVIRHATVRRIPPAGSAQLKRTRAM